MFHWNDANITHIAQHGVTPAEAEQIILNGPIDLEFSHRSKELRVAQIGETDKGRILVVVSTWRSGLIRVITAYPAKKRLRILYAAQKAKRYEKRISEEELQE
jgi:uncharacterized protein